MGNLEILVILMKMERRKMSSSAGYAISTLVSQWSNARCPELDQPENIDSNKLFHLLPQEHRDAFLAAIRDPDSEAGRELLKTLNEDEAEEPTLPTALPWWESSDVHEDPESDNDEVQYAEIPCSLSTELLATVSPPNDMGCKLVYNALALW